ncbi:ribosome silencing factor [Lentibacillus saliphilus]|uniref:ribosome silencing factor n=1 Tax=Lentibacillus saliphilus TaxID=2737028 RepID=UPI001C2FF397|nr:ribosome silencing factor [Lentibacillus saliphilus]
MNGIDMIQIAANACDQKRAEDIIALDMKDVSLVADYFLICHGNSERQVQAIASAIKDALEEENISVKRLEGYEQARWVLVDTGYIVCHVFHKDERGYYNLERLWGDADHISLNFEQDDVHDI